MPMVGRTPRLSSRPVIGKPWPWIISFSGVTEKETPRSTIRSSSSSGRSLPWTMLMLGADETRLDQLLPAAGRLRGTAALMHRCDQVELARQAEVVQGDVERRIVRAEDREPERDEAVAVGEGPRQQSLDFVAWMRDLGEMRLARFRLGLGRAVEEGGADAALDQAAHGGVGMIGRRIVVAPVDQRGGAAS